MADYFKYDVFRQQFYENLLRACPKPEDPSGEEAQGARAQLAERNIQLKYDAHIWAYAFSPDGRRALTGADDNTVRLWNLETGRCIRVLEGHTDCVFSVDWSADQRRALSGSRDKTMRLWEVKTGRCLRVFEGHTDHVVTVALGSDQCRALSGSSDKTMRLWDIEMGCCLRVFEGHTDDIRRLKWSADQRRALSGSLDKTMRLWDVDTGRLLRVLQSPIEIACMAWSTDERLVLSGGPDAMRLWNVETGLCLRIFKVPISWIWELAWSTDQRFALSCSTDGAMLLWDVESGCCLLVRDDHRGSSVYSASWSADQRRAFFGDERGTIRVWNLSEFVTATRAPEALAPISPGLVLDNESKERALVGKVISTVALAGQIIEEYSAKRYGLDMEIEFKNDEGKPTARKLYLQLKSGDSHLYKRKSDGAEIFQVHHQDHVSYWMNQEYPVFLVIGNSKGEVRWMEVRDWLKHASDNGKKTVKHIVFAGERFDVMSVRRWRDRVLATTVP